MLLSSGRQLTAPATSACAGRCLATARLTRRLSAAPTAKTTAAHFPGWSSLSSINSSVCGSAEPHLHRSGFDSRHSCVAFKPRRSSFRQCRQSSIDLHCHASASPAVEPPYPEPAHPLFRFAAALLAIWQHSRDRLVNFIEWKGGQQDVTVQVCKACCCKPAAC